MRDKNRIDNICERIAAVWKRCPDWRFMQLMCNFQSTRHNDSFYMEDEQFIDFLEAAANEWFGKDEQ